MHITFLKTLHSFQLQLNANEFVVIICLLKHVFVKVSIQNHLSVRKIFPNFNKIIDTRTYIIFPNLTQKNTITD